MIFESILGSYQILSMHIEILHTVSELLRFALDDNKNKQENSPWQTDQHAKAHEEVPQGVFLDSSRRIEQKIKSIFKKPFSVSKMLCQVFNQLFSPIAKNIFSGIHGISKGC